VIPGQIEASSPLQAGLSFPEPPALSTLQKEPMASQDSSSPLQANLSFVEPPGLNKVVQVTAVFSLHKDFKYDLHDVTARIILPEGIEKVDGELA
jgi:hypothetical protein